MQAVESHFWCKNYSGSEISTPSERIHKNRQRNGTRTAKMNNNRSVLISSSCVQTLLFVWRRFVLFFCFFQLRRVDRFFLEMSDVLFHHPQVMQHRIAVPESPQQGGKLPLIYDLFAWLLQLKLVTLTVVKRVRVLVELKLICSVSLLSSLGSFTPDICRVYFRMSVGQFQALTQMFIPHLLTRQSFPSLAYLITVHSHMLEKDRFCNVHFVCRAALAAEIMSSSTFLFMVLLQKTWDLFELPKFREIDLHLKKKNASLWKRKYLRTDNVKSFTLRVIICPENKILSSQPQWCNNSWSPLFPSTYTTPSNYCGLSLQSAVTPQSIELVTYSFSHSLAVFPTMRPRNCCFWVLSSALPTVCVCASSFVSDVNANS